MKKIAWLLTFLVMFSIFAAAPADAAGRDVLKIGLKYGNNALFAANLQNEKGKGYQFGWFDDDRQFWTLGETEEMKITMIASGDIYMNSAGAYSPDMPSGVHRVLGGYHIQLDGYSDFHTAAQDAANYGGWPAYLDGEYVVRVGSYTSAYEAESSPYYGQGNVVTSGDTGVMVTVTGTERILFEFDCGGTASFGVMPRGWGEAPVTWFKGYRYKGGFEYQRSAGGNLNVVNVVDLEDYVKGVVPYEMNGNWPLAALEAQAVCARTFAKACTKHLRSDGFDVCNDQHCQVYYGVNKATETSDRAVDNTAGQCIYYNGELVPDAVYHSSNGGATEDGAVVWGGASPYLKGKPDPYESTITIPNYSWSVTYSASELSWILEQKGENIGQVRNAYVSRLTTNGNVAEVTFEGSRGTLKVTGEKCRTIFYSSTYNKSVHSLRFQINGGTSGGLYVNDGGSPLETLEGISVLSGDGTMHVLPENTASVMTGSGLATVAGGGVMSGAPDEADSFTITGTGNGHNVGLSQYGAKAMAEQGMNYFDILTFYYTDITVG